MSKDKFRANVTVTVTIKLYGPEVWESDCTITKVHQEAMKIALERLPKLIDPAYGYVVGEPVVKLVQSELER